MSVRTFMRFLNIIILKSINTNTGFRTSISTNVFKGPSIVLIIVFA